MRQLPTYPQTRTGYVRNKATLPAKLLNSGSDSENDPSTLKKPSKVTKKFRAEVLAKLKVTEEQLATVPPMTAIFQEASGGLADVIVAMRFSTDPIVEKFLKKYDVLSKDERDAVPLEAVAIAADVEIPYLIGAVLLAIRYYTMNIVKVIAMTGHPESMKARVRNAKLIGGHRDREALDTGLGFLPQKREGQSFFVRGNLQLGSGDAPESLTGAAQPALPDGCEESKEPDLDVLFPDVSQMQKRIAPIRQLNTEKE